MLVRSRRFFDELARFRIQAEVSQHTVGCIPGGFQGFQCRVCLVTAGRRLDGETYFYLYHTSSSV